MNHVITPARCPWPSRPAGTASIISTGAEPPQGPPPAAASWRALRVPAAHFLRPHAQENAPREGFPLTRLVPCKNSPSVPGRGCYGEGCRPPSEPPANPDPAPRRHGHRLACCRNDAREMRWWLWVDRTLRNNHNQRTGPRKRFAGSLGSRASLPGKCSVPETSRPLGNHHGIVVRPREQAGPTLFHRRRSGRPRTRAPAQAASGHRPGRRS